MTRRFLHIFLFWAVSLSTVYCSYSQNNRIDSLKKEISEASDPAQTRDALRELIYVYSDIDRLESRRYANQAVELSRRLGETTELAIDYYLLATTYFYQGNPDSALLFTDSISIALTVDAVGNDIRLTDSIRLKNIILKAACYRAKGDFPEAVTLNMTGLSLAKKLGNRTLEAAISNNLGNIFVNMEQTRKGLSNYQRAARYYQSENQPLRLAQAFENIGDAYYELGMYDSAQYYLRKCIALKAKPGSLALAYFMLGKTFMKTDQSDSAWKYLQLTFDISRSLKHDKLEIMALNQIASYLGNKGKFKEARDKLDFAAKRSEELGLAFQMAKNKFIYSEVEALAGNYQQSVTYLHQYNAIKDSLLNREMNDKVAYYQEKFNAEERELEIARLAQAKAENEADLNQQKYLWSLTISGLLLALLVGIGILVIYFRALRSKQVLASKNERLQELNREATEARISAEEATRAKSAFLANMTHEIRTPINGVIGVTDILQYTRLSDEQHVYIQTIRRSGENLLRIVNEVLDFSKIEAGKMQLEETEFNLFDLMDEVLVLFSSQRSDKDLDLACLIDHRLPATLKGDPHKLRQVLINLVGNAMKFTNEGGVFIRIGMLSPAGSDDRLALQVEVEDTGIGITEEQSKKLFQAFEQADSGIAKKFGGTGLGLTISAKLVELMGGKLEFESEYGKGSRFFFRFELNQPPADPNGTIQSTWLPEGVATYWEGKAALVLEDRKWSRETLTSWFEITGVTPHFVSDYASAVELVETGTIEVALYAIDYQEKPDENQLESLRDGIRAKGIPMILMGTMSQIANQKELLPENDRVLTKPLQHSDFFRLLRNIATGQAPALDKSRKPTLEPVQKLGQSLSMRILLAEDNDINQMIAVRMFTRLGFEPDFASNGHKVLEKCESNPYDVIFMDVNMPEMDGLEATRILHERYPAGKRPVIIAVTANAMEGDRETCLRAGMDDYMSKPLRADKFQEMLLKYGLKKKETGRE